LWSQGEQPIEGYTESSKGGLMETDKKEIQPTQGTSTEAGSAESKPTEEAPAVKEASYDELKADNERKDHQIRTLQGIVRTKERQSVTREDFDSLRKELGDNLTFTAQMLDELANKAVAGEFSENVQPATAQRKSFAQQVEERKKAEKEKPQPIDPVAQAFVNLMSSNGMNWDSLEVKEALGETEGIARTPQEAFDHLTKTIEGKRHGEIETEAQKQANLIFEKKMKELGFAGTGAVAPSAPGQADTSKMSGRELILQGLKDREKSK
jgi:hypothetical protein